MISIRWRIMWNPLDGCLWSAFYEGGRDEPYGTLWSMEILEEGKNMIKRTRRYGYKGGIHFCMRRYTWRQEIKNLIDWGIQREERAEW